MKPAHCLLLVKSKKKLRRARRGALVWVFGALSTLAEALAIIMDVLPMDLKIRRRATNYWLGKGLLK